jgi:hypothetical protein
VQSLARLLPLLLASACVSAQPPLPTALPAATLSFAKPVANVEARLLDCRPLLYSEDSAPELDRPAFVRSASGMERFGNGFAILQDDLNSVGLVDDDGPTRYLELPRPSAEPQRFEHDRGNLHLKSDYEAAFVLREGDQQRLFAFGSGTLPPRERIAIITTSGAARRLNAAPFYRALREARDFSGGSLNLEAAEVHGDWLLLLQRGSVERGVRNALAGVSLPDFLAWADGEGAVPRVRWVRRFDLGSAGGVAFGFSGLSALRDGRLVFTASAEGGATPHANGTILGSRLGLLGHGAAWWVPIVDSTGQAVSLKVEGVVPDPDDPRRFLLTTDPDDASEPALFCSVVLSGDWPANLTPTFQPEHQL